MNPTFSSNKFHVFNRSNGKYLCKHDRIHRPIFTKHVAHAAKFDNETACKFVDNFNSQSYHSGKYGDNKLSGEWRVVEAEYKETNPFRNYFGKASITSDLIEDVFPKE